MARSKSQKIESFYLDGDTLAKLEAYRAGKKLTTGKHVQYTTAVKWLIDAALEGTAPIERNPLPSILARLNRLEKHCKLP